MKGLLYLSIFLFLGFGTLQAQETEQEEKKIMSLDEGTINEQFEFVRRKSGPYRAAGVRYRVVKVVNFNKLKANALDSLSTAYKKNTALQNTISQHVATITDLNQKLDGTTKNLTSITEEKDSMSLLGMSVSKITYNLILWSVIAGLLTLLVLFIYKFRRSNVLTQEAKSNLSELEAEYEDHRRRALEREQKVSRQLMDERNKNKG